MNETADLVRHLFDHLTVAGTLTEDDWLRFKSDHRVEPEQIEVVLVLTIHHLCSLAGELQQEADRLSIALQPRRSAPCP